eukprot:IDg18735t1
MPTTMKGAMTDPMDSSAMIRVAARFLMMKQGAPSAALIAVLSCVAALLLVGFCCLFFCIRRAIRSSGDSVAPSVENKFGKPVSNASLDMRAFRRTPLHSAPPPRTDAALPREREKASLDPAYHNQTACAMHAAPFARAPIICARSDRPMRPALHARHPIYSTHKPRPPRAVSLSCRFAPMRKCETQAREIMRRDARYRAAAVRVRAAGELRRAAIVRPNAEARQTRRQYCTIIGLVDTRRRQVLLPLRS